MKLPSIDGYFWIVREGKIIDWDFPEYAEVRSYWKCGTEKDYIPAPPVTQQLMINIFQKCLSSHYKGLEWYDVIEKFYKKSKAFHLIEPQFNCCYQNCLIELYLRGGELVFGSLGFKKKNGTGFHYEYGGDSYKTVTDFIKKNEIPQIPQKVKIVKVKRTALEFKELLLKEAEDFRV